MHSPPAPGSVVSSASSCYVTGMRDTRRQARTTISRALDALDALRVTYVGIDLQAAGIAGEARSRSRIHRRITADYLIAAHAARHADRLLTRDADFSTLDVPGLRAVTPAQVLAAPGN